MAQYRSWTFRLFTGLRRFSGILAVWAGSLAFSTGTTPVIIQETRPFVVVAKQLIAFTKNENLSPPRLFAAFYQRHPSA